MIVLFPKKWAHLSPFSAGSVPDEPVSFVDFAPTLLSLIGQDKPEQMQGRAFLGSKRVDPAKDEAEFLYADRFDAVSTCMRRGLTTGRWKYIRRFTPYYPAAPYSNYQFGQAGWNAWREAWKKGELKPEFAKMWETPQPVEELYDTENDPWEINNLATSPEHQQRLTNMRQALMKQMIAARDSSIVPEAMFEPLARDQPLSVYVTSREVDLPALFQLAFLASAATKMDLPTLTKNLNSDDPLTRYWAAHGLRILGMDAAPAKESLSKLTKDPMAEIRITAAEALHCLGQPSFELLIDVLSGDAHDAAKARAINALVQMGANKQVPKEIYENLRKGVSRQLKPYLNSIK